MVGEWDGLWTEGNNNETWTRKCGLKEIIMKHEQKSVDWEK